MEQIRPFARPKKDYTQLHNSLFDVVMPTLKPNAWKLLCFILRKTNGWNKPEEQLSYSQLRAGTGISSDATLATTIKDLVDARYLIVTPTQWQSSTYALNYDFILATNEQPELVSGDEADLPVSPTTKNEASSKTEVATEIKDASKSVELSTTKIEEVPTSKIEDTKINDIKEKGKEIALQPEQPTVSAPIPPATSGNGFESLMGAARERANGNYGKRRDQVQIDGVQKKLEKFGIDKEQFREMVDAHLLAKGTKVLADGDGDAADRELRKAQQFVVDLCGVGQRFWERNGVSLVWDSWKANDWRGDPSEQQLLEHASQMVAGKFDKPQQAKAKPSKPFGGNNGEASAPKLRNMNILWDGKS